MIYRFMRFCWVCLGLILVAKIAPKCMRYRMGVWLFCRGGVSFIKLAQILSVRPDIVGTAWATHLKSLQDQAPPFSAKTAKKIFQNACGMSVDSVFMDFSEIPVGSASIAQVHKAVLYDGTLVAVKILRPHIRQKFFGDIKVFYKLARMLEKISKKSRRLRPCQVVDELRTWVHAELDLTIEAKNAERLHKNFKDDPKFYVPPIYHTYTTADVLTTEWIDGVRIDDITTLKKWNLDCTQLLTDSTRIFFLQVFRDGFFHADIHPGNMFVRADGVLCPVDFGIMGYLSKKTRIYIADCLYYLYKGDYTRVAEVHFIAGYVPATYGVNAFANALKKIAIDRTGMDWSAVAMGQLLSDLFTVTEKFQMRVRPELLLLQKTLIVAEGTGRVLAPQRNMWALIADIMEQWMRVNRGIPARIETLLSDIYNAHHPPKKQQDT